MVSHWGGGSVFLLQESGFSMIGAHTDSQGDRTTRPNFESRGNQTPEIKPWIFVGLRPSKGLFMGLSLYVETCSWNEYIS